MSTKSKIISIDDIKIGMVVDEDVFNSTGMLLISKDTVISQRHIFRLKLYQVYGVPIREPKEAIIEEVKPSISQQHITAHPSFIQFNEAYEETQDSVKGAIDDVANAEDLNVKDLFKLTQDLVSSLNTKNELFNYLNHLKATQEQTYTHCLNVSILCNIFAHWLKWPKDKIEEITVAGLLHDIGKLAIDNAILNKPGKLTAKEFEIVKTHPKVAYDMIKDRSEFSDAIKLGVLMHHERIDGSGYPMGLTGDRIHEFAKIIGIVDIYDAMTSERSYHRKFSPFRVIRLFEQETYGILDTKFLFVFLDNIAHNYIGSKVKLSNGDVGEVIFINKQMPSRPIVQIDSKMLDLQFSPELEIDEIL